MFTLNDCGDEFFDSGKCKCCSEDLIVDHGYVVCPSCGFVDNKAPMDIQPVNLMMQKKENLGSQLGGNIFEIIGLPAREKFRRIANLQNYEDDAYTKNVIRKANCVLKKFLSSAKIKVDPLHNKAIINMFRRFFDSKRRVRYKNPLYSIPVLAFLYYRSHDRLISKKDLLQNSQISESLYYKIFGKLNKHKWFKKLKRLDLKDEIFIYLSQFRDKYNLGKQFIDEAVLIIMRHWNMLTGPGINGSARLIAATVAYILSPQTVASMTLKEFCSFFGNIQYKSLQARVDILSEKFGVKDFTTLSLNKANGNLQRIQTLKHYILTPEGALRNNIHGKRHKEVSSRDSQELQSYFSMINMRSLKRKQKHIRTSRTVRSIRTHLRNNMTSKKIPETLYMICYRRIKNPQPFHYSSPFGQTINQDNHEWRLDVHIHFIYKYYNTRGWEVAITVLIIIFDIALIRIFIFIKIIEKYHNLLKIQLTGKDPPFF